MSSTAIQIKDSGKVKSTDVSATYTQVDSGNWINFYYFTLRWEFDATKNTNTSPRSDENDRSFWFYEKNDVGSLVTPRITMQGLVPQAEAVQINKLIKLQRTKGLKQVTGGIGVIDNLPEKQNDGTYNFVYVKVYNVKVTESEQNATDSMNVTVQLEVV